MLSIVLGTLQVVYALILPIVMKGIYYYHTNFTDEETGEVINMLKVLLW